MLDNRLCFSISVHSLKGFGLGVFFVALLKLLLILKLFSEVQPKLFLDRPEAAAAALVIFYF